MSEVARLRAQIEAEYQAAYWGLHGAAIVAKHEFISKRLEMVDVLCRKLAVLVGDEQAIEIVVGIADRQGEGS